MPQLPGLHREDNGKSSRLCCRGCRGAPTASLLPTGSGWFGGVVLGLRAPYTHPLWGCPSAFSLGGWGRCGCSVPGGAEPSLGCHICISADGSNLSLGSKNCPWAAKTGLGEKTPLGLVPTSAESKI